GGDARRDRPAQRILRGHADLPQRLLQLSGRAAAGITPGHGRGRGLRLLAPRLPDRPALVDAATGIVVSYPSFIASAPGTSPWSSRPRASRSPCSTSRSCPSAPSCPPPTRPQPPRSTRTRSPSPGPSSRSPPLRSPPSCPATSGASSSGPMRRRVCPLQARRRLLRR
ncbi:hypothetical protein CFC21_094564, partial [Triticum aestivum]